MRLVFDIETDGLLDQLSKIHCVVAIDLDTDEVFQFRPDQIDYAVLFLSEADELVGHNIMGFDIPAIQKLYKWFKPKKVTDTLVMTRLYWPNIREIDVVKRPGMGRMMGSHSLEAWGLRLGNHKDDFGKTTDWSEFSEEMLEYCLQDVWVNYDLVKVIDKKPFSQDAIDLEHKIHQICLEQEWMGFPFNEKEAAKFYAELSARREEVRQQLTRDVAPWYASNGETMPKRSVKYKDPLKPDITEGAPYTKIKMVYFNPSSRQHISRLLQSKGWVPEKFTETGVPMIDDAVLKDIDIPEAQLIAESFLLDKRIGQLAEGTNAWMKLSKNGRIHGRCLAQSTVTSRATHQSPNLAQVPSTSAEYGHRCRSLFYAPDGWEIMGSDQSGIELRCLAHYMSKWDGGAYANEILQGDIHQANADAVGLSRKEAKIFIYALCYGAGDFKIGSIIGKGAAAGKKMKDKFFRKIPALKKLTDAVQAKTKSAGVIKGIDGRTVPVRSQHSSLNTLLQSCGAILAKRWVVTFHEICKERGYVHGVDYQQLAWVHDEIQVLVKKGKGDEFGEISQLAMRATERYYNFRIQLDTEYSVGSSWAETH